MISQDTLHRWLVFIKKHESVGSMVCGVLVLIGIIAGAIYVKTSFSLTNFSKSSVVPPVTNDVPESAFSDLKILETPEGSTSSSQVQSTYTVQAGEGLWQIAEKLYGDGNHYLKIYELNRDQMKSPEDIRTGMVLKIER